MTDLMQEIPEDLDEHFVAHMEPVEIGCIIRFALEYDHEGKRKTYRFAAIQGIKHQWFWTGRTCPENGASWAELVTLMYQQCPKHQRYYDIIWPVPRMERVDL